MTVAKLVGINHVALEVGGIDEALAWYGQFFEVELRGRIGSQMAFVDMGDQFIALARGRTQPPDSARHVGLVVDDKEGVRAALVAAGVSVTRAPDCSFHDPWGNHVQVVDYRDVQFTKTDRILRGLGVSPEKSESAMRELREKGLAD
jgi:catechol 2,3-dioxygenase-like lactoylglutathione lyase family enzyme